MKITGLRKIVGTKAAMVCVTVSVCAGAGVAAAAATDSAPWQERSSAPVADEPVTTAVAVEPTSSAADEVSTTAISEPVVTDAAAPTTLELPPTTEPPTVVPSTTPEATTTAPEPATPGTAVPDTPAPDTTVRRDTFVPQGIELHCAVDGTTVTCEWSGAAVEGFAKVLVLRGDGRVVFISTDPSAAGYIDQAVPAGSYSYVVVAIDGNSKTLVHSNPVFVQIGAAG